MTETFAVYAPGTRTTGANGYSAQGYTSQGSTKGKFQGRQVGHDGWTSELELIGGVKRVVFREALHVPIGSVVPVAGPVGTGWEYECTAVGPLSDPSLLGRRFLVIGVPAKSSATARRLDVVEI